jgi:NADH:ubiquinone oxidoreductase subunit 3 (subunit A)
LNEYGGGELFGVLIYFLLVLLLGLFYEWHEGALIWSI